MTPKQYQKKYKLDTEGMGKWKQDSFLFDLSNDFISLLQYHMQSRSTFDLQAWEDVIAQIETKWNSINNKTIGNLPESLWNYFYATVIKPAKYGAFEGLADWEEQVFQMNYEELLIEVNELVEMKALFEKKIEGYRTRGNWHLVEIYKHRKNVNNPFDKYTLDNYLSRAEAYYTRKEEAEKKREEERFRRWKEQQKRYNDFFHFDASGSMGHDNFWDSFFAGFIGSMFSNREKVCPIESFIILGLSKDAKETEIKTAYRQLAMIHHPDKGGSQEKFVEITEAKNRCLAFVT